MKTIALLTLSNVFMTFAWYGHLKHKATLTIPLAILISWLIALPEYCFQVPANRLGSESMSTPQLKILQEVITLIVFSVFSVWYLGERIRWNDAVGFLFILGAVFFVFAFKAAPDSRSSAVEDEAGAHVPGGSAYESRTAPTGPEQLSPGQRPGESETNVISSPEDDMRKGGPPCGSR